MKKPMTLVIVALNEVENMERCILSARDLVDEILVVDSGSTDGTPQVAEKCGARVLHEKWRGFGPQKTGQ